MLGVEDGDKSKAQPQAQNNRIGFGYGLSQEFHAL